MTISPIVCSTAAGSTARLDLGCAGGGTPDGPAPVIKISATNNSETVTTKKKEVTVTITNP